jgi:VWFA-related protein
MNGFRFPLAALALACWAPLHAAEPAATARAGELVDVDVVNVEVYVTGKDGRPVTGLERGDFKLLEDGKPMEIVNFAAVDRQAAAPLQAAAAPSGEAAAPQAAAEAADANDRLHLVVFVDDTHISPAHRARVLRQLHGFLDRRLEAADRVMLVTSDPGLHVRVPFTSDRVGLGRALDALEKAAATGPDPGRARRAALEQVISIQEQAAMTQQKEDLRQENIGKRLPEDALRQNPDAVQDVRCPPEIVEPVKSYAEAERREVLRSITGLTVLVNSLSALPGRKALIYVSDGLSVTPGEDLFQVLHEMCGGGAGTSGASGLPIADTQASSGRTYRATQAMLDAQAYSTATQWNDLAAHASAQRVTFYPFQASGAEAAAASSSDMGPGDRMLQLSSVASIETANRRGSLTALASGTGGRAVLDANELGPELARLDDDFGHYYSLGYTPPHRGDGKDHRIAVELDRPGLQVRNRQVYRDKPLLERAVDRTLSALFLGTGDNPLGVSLEIGQTAPGQPSGFVVPVRLLIPLANVGLSMRGDGYDGKLRILVATMSPRGGNSPVRQVEVPLRIPMEGSGAAMMQSYLYEIKLTLPPGENRLAVGIRDDVTTLASFLTRTIDVGGGPAR